MSKVVSNLSASCWGSRFQYSWFSARLIYRINNNGTNDQEHAFDAFAVPEPVDDGGMFDDGGEGGVDGDYDDDLGEYSERALGHAGQLITI